MFTVKNRKSEQHHWVLHSRISLSTKFHLKLIILIFGTKFAQYGWFQYKTEKNEQHHWILHIWISLGTIFHLKLTILISWTKFAQKGCRTGAERHNVILMPLLVTETINFNIFNTSSESRSVISNLWNIFLASSESRSVISNLWNIFLALRRLVTLAAMVPPRQKPWKIFLCTYRRYTGSKDKKKQKKDLTTNIQIRKIFTTNRLLVS